MKTKTKDKKVIFRRSKEWKTFRQELKKKQKTDPITGSPLTKMCNCHHLDENPKNYTDITDESKFICLNSMTHTCVHWLWGDAQHRNNWRTRLKRLIELLELMDEINGEYKK